MTEFEATLVSETGIQAVLRDATSEVALPVGKYRMYALQVSLKDGQGHWIFRFAGNSTATADLFQVRKGDTTRFDPIGQLKLHATSSRGHSGGETAILITPCLTTSTGLYLTASWVGESAARGAADWNPGSDSSHLQSELLTANPSIGWT